MVYERRWETVKQRLKKGGYDAFIATKPGNVRYLCCTHLLDPVLWVIVIPSKGEPLGITSTLEATRAGEESAVGDLRVFGDCPGVPTYGKKGVGVLKKVLREARIERVLFDSPIGIGGRKDDAITRMRMCKGPDEIEKMRKAAAIAVRGSQWLRDGLEGKTEAEVAAELDYHLRRAGAQALSFRTIVASGEHAAYPHHDPTSRVIGQGDTVICDFGAYWDGYCSDITRTFIMGEPDARLLEAYDLVAEAQREAIAAIRTGEVFGTLDNKARRMFKQHGQGQHFPHGLGHGLGLDIHEEPAIGHGATKRMGEGMVFTIEPGLYLPGLGGVRIEDDVYLGKQGAEVLTG